MAISGNTVVSGNPNASSGGGAAYVWAKPASGWANVNQTAKLTASDGGCKPYCYNLGYSAAISGSTVVAGAPGATVKGNHNQGAAYVFVEPSSGWHNMTQTAKLTASDGQVSDGLGFSVSVDDNTVVAGRYAGVPVPAYVWVEPEAGWIDMTQKAELTRTDEAALGFGYSVAISGNTAVVGAPGYVGAAYVFVEPATGWANMTETATVSPGIDNFGSPVAISGNTVVVPGAPGAAYIFLPSPVPGQNYTVPHSFSGPDGDRPSGSLIEDANGNLYGTAFYGGRTGSGVVFKLDTTGTETVLHEFGFVGPKNDGANPAAGLARDAAGNLYGTTVNGGTSGLGAIFEFTAKHYETVLHSFAGYPTDGAYPYAGLIRDAAGNLYGTTSAGGAFGDGTVFKLAPTGKETVLHNFTGGADGGGPYGGLIRDAPGNLYGTTSIGGSSPCSGGDGCGVVFKLSPAGKETVLYSFHGTDGANPYAGLVRDAASNLYGTTYNGGPGGAFGNGVVFKLDAAGRETVLYSFTGGFDGGNPYGGLSRDAAGNLYGTTRYGGSFSGVVFKLDPSGNETVLHSFYSGGTDGTNPDAGVLRDAAGNLYGTTVYGGESGDGAVFKITP